MSEEAKAQPTGDAVKENPQPAKGGPATAETNGNGTAEGAVADAPAKEEPPAEPPIELPVKMPLYMPTRKLDSHPYFSEFDTIEYSEEMLAKCEEKEPAKVADFPTKEITDAEKLKEAVEELKKAKAVGVSLIANRDDFEGTVCYLMLCSDECNYVLDVLALKDDMKLLAPVFVDPNIVKVLYRTKVFLYWLQQVCGLYVANLFEIERGMRSVSGNKFVPMKTALQKYYSVTAPAGFAKYNFSERPTAEKTLEYIRMCSHYLLHVYRKIKNELLDKHGVDKLKIILDDMNELCKLHYDDPKQLMKDTVISDMRRYQTGQKNIMKELEEWRMVIARAENVNPNKVIELECMKALAMNMPDKKDTIKAMTPSAHVAKELEKIAKVVLDNRYVGTQYNQLLNSLRNKMLAAQKQNLRAKLFAQSKIATVKRKMGMAPPPPRPLFPAKRPRMMGPPSYHAPQRQPFINPGPRPLFSINPRPQPFANPRPQQQFNRSYNANSSFNSYSQGGTGGGGYRKNYQSYGDDYQDYGNDYQDDYGQDDYGQEDYQDDYQDDYGQDDYQDDYSQAPSRGNYQGFGGGGGDQYGARSKPAPLAYGSSPRSTFSNNYQQRQQTQSYGNSGGVGGGAGFGRPYANPRGPRGTSTPTNPRAPFQQQTNSRFAGGRGGGDSFSNGAGWSGNGDDSYGQSRPWRSSAPQQRPQQMATRSVPAQGNNNPYRFYRNNPY